MAEEGGLVVVTHEMSFARELEGGGHFVGD